MSISGRTYCPVVQKAWLGRCLRDALESAIKRPGRVWGRVGEYDPRMGTKLPRQWYSYSCTTTTRSYSESTPSQMGDTNESGLFPGNDFTVASIGGNVLDRNRMGRLSLEQAEQRIDYTKQRHLVFMHIRWVRGVLVQVDSGSRQTECPCRS